MRLRPFVIVLLLAGLVITLPDAAVGADFQTAGFALPASAFPQPAEIVISRTESNTLAAQDDLVRSQGATLASSGRVTGYFVRAAQTNIDATGHSHPVITSYLVSAFAATQDAAHAFDLHRQAWLAALQHPPAGTAVNQQQTTSVHAGDSHRVAEFTSTATGEQNAKSVLELFFATRYVLVQIWQYTSLSDATPYGRPARKLVPGMAESLNGVAKKFAVPPAGFRIVSLRAEAYGSPALSKVVGAGSLIVSVRKPVYLSAYVHVYRALLPATLGARFSIAIAGKGQDDFQVTEPLPSHPAGFYRVFIPYRFRAAGRVTVSVQVTVDNVVHRETVSFNASG
ncbi:MAG TPA: hypothetical protein VF898_07210 [Chloroflexota bacterium]